MRFTDAAEVLLFQFLFWEQKLFCVLWWVVCESVGAVALCIVKLSAFSFSLITLYFYIHIRVTFRLTSKKTYCFYCHLIAKWYICLFWPFSCLVANIPGRKFYLHAFLLGKWWPYTLTPTPSSIFNPTAYHICRFFLGCSYSTQTGCQSFHNHFNLLICL